MKSREKKLLQIKEAWDISTKYKYRIQLGTDSNKSPKKPVFLYN